MPDKEHQTDTMQIKTVSGTEETSSKTGSQDKVSLTDDTVVVTDFADLECEASAKSVAVCATREQ